MKLLTMLLVATLSLASSPALAGAPVVDAVALAQADRIASMDDAEPVARLNQLLAARDLSDAALFALATTHPGLIEQLTSAKYVQALDYIGSLPAPELGRVRRGETVIRTAKVLRGFELENAQALADTFGFNVKKLEAVRCASHEGRVYRVEVTATGKKKTTDRGTIELAWPSTPERDEKSREILSKHFGARPSRNASGAGALVPLVDGSFEDESSWNKDWVLEDGVVFGSRVPVADVVIDSSQAIDGLHSVRFHATDQTRMFPEVVQRVTIAPGTWLRARAQHMTDNVRREFQQQPDDIYLEMSFEDITGRPIGSPFVDRGRTATHAWELLEVTGQAPMGTAYVKIAVFSGLSGTAWFDGVVLEIAAP